VPGAEPPLPTMPPVPATRPPVPKRPPVPDPPSGPPMPPAPAPPEPVCPPCPVVPPDPVPPTPLPPVPAAVPPTPDPPVPSPISEPDAQARPPTNRAARRERRTASLRMRVLPSSRRRATLTGDSVTCGGFLQLNGCRLHARFVIDTDGNRMFGERIASAHRAEPPRIV
jgi:hypothetical protein